MNTVQSADGTRIAFDRVGSGPALILVDGALCRRSFGPMPKLAELLLTRFTVFTYDRRGRGDSTDAASYAVARELEDLAALLAVAGGSASLFGASSGAALSLEAAACGLPVRKLVLYEPPFVSEGASGAEPDHVATLRQHLAHGRRGAAVKYFMQDMVRAPAPAVLMMRCLFPVWSKLKAAAHTLPYDATIMGDWSVPTARAAEVKVPSLVLHGGKTDPRLRRAARALAAAIPGAEQGELAGQNHNAQARVLAPVLCEFLARARAN
jgi:pimeloyl-ACP methyl ester carboxylesterase